MLITVSCCAAASPRKATPTLKNRSKVNFSMFSYLSAPQTLTVCYLTFSLVPNFELHLRFVPMQSHRVGKSG